MVHAAEHGNIVMTTAPFLEVRLIADDEKQSPLRRRQQGKPAAQTSASPARRGRSLGAERSCTCACNGANGTTSTRAGLSQRSAGQGPELSRYTTPERFARTAVKGGPRRRQVRSDEFALELKQDTHVIVMAVGEKKNRCWGSCKAPLGADQNRSPSRIYLRGRRWRRLSKPTATHSLPLP